SSMGEGKGAWGQKRAMVSPTLPRALCRGPAMEVKSSPEAPKPCKHMRAWVAPDGMTVGPDKGRGEFMTKGYMLDNSLAKQLLLAALAVMALAGVANAADDDTVNREEMMSVVEMNGRQL